MKTRLSKSFDRKVKVYQATSDGTFSFVSSVWARVEEVNYENYDTVGQSINNYDKKVVCRLKDLNTNTNAFLIDGELYQINRVSANHKKTQYLYYVSNANVSIPLEEFGTALFINGKALIINDSNALFL